MKLNSATPAFDEPPRSTLYIVVWSLLALLALAYLALLAIRPDLAAGMIANPPFGTPEGNQGQRAMFRAVAEVQELKKSTARLQSDIGDLKTAMSADQQRVLALEARIAALEAQRTAGVPMAEASPAAQRSGAPEAGSGTGGLAGANVTGEVIEAPARPRKETKALQKSVATATAAPVEAKGADAAPQAPAGPPMGLLISTGPSLDAVRLTWQLLLEGHRSTLRALEPRFVETPADPPSYQLIAGPISTREAASRACERLRAKQARCQVTPFTGQPL